MATERENGDSMLFAGSHCVEGKEKGKWRALSGFQVSHPPRQGRFGRSYRIQGG